MMGAALALVGRLAKAAGFDQDAHDDIRIAVHEALVNAVVHGNEGEEARRVSLRLALHADRLEIRVQDEAWDFDPGTAPDALAPENPVKPTGQGIVMMRALMDEVTFRRLVPGMEVTMVKRLPTAAAPAGTTDGVPLFQGVPSTER